MTTPVLAPTHPEIQAEEASPTWRVTRALARAEARRLVRSPAMIVAFALTVALTAPWSFWPEVPDLRLQAADSPFNAYLLAAATLVATNLAALRARRHRTEELFASTPAPPDSRTASHVVAAAVPFIVVAALVAAVTIALAVFRDGFGRPDGADLAVGPLFVLGAAALGVVLARWVPNPVAAPAACVAIAAFELYMTNRSSTNPVRRLGFWVGGEELPPELLPGRLTRWHLAYLVGLIALAVIGALLAHGFRRRLVVSGVLALALVGTSVWIQTRPPSAASWAARNDLLARPQAHQVCEERPSGRFCAYPAYRSLVDYWARPVDGVRAEVPAGVWPEGLEVSQRLSTNDRQYITGARLKQLVRVLPGMDDPLPDDGALHPPILWDTTGRAELGLGLLTASRVVNLPLVASEPDVRCDATGQARAVVALWLAGQASSSSRSSLDRLAHEASLDLGRAVVVMPDFGTASGVAWGATEVGYALALLDRPGAEVGAALARDWEFFTDPATPSAAVAERLGLPAESVNRVGPARRGFGGFGSLDSGPVPQLGSPCR